MIEFRDKRPKVSTTLPPLRFGVLIYPPAICMENLNPSNPFGPLRQDDRIPSRRRTWDTVWKMEVYKSCLPTSMYVSPLDLMPFLPSHPSTADYGIYIYIFGPWIL